MIVGVRRSHGSLTGIGQSGQGGASPSLQAPFKEVLAQTDKASKIPSDPFQAMRQLSARVQSGDALTSRELLLYQIRAGQYGLRVELVSKVGESLSASLRKLQNQG